MSKSCKKVTIISRESDSKTLDIKLLEEELVRRGLEVETLCRLLEKGKSLKSLGYIGHVAKQERAILNSDVVVVDTYCIPVSMMPHGRAKVIQIWHSLGAIKKFGWQSAGKQSGSSQKIAKIMRMHKGYDYVLSPSDVTSEYYCEAFKTDAQKIVKIGLPRIDYIRSVVFGSRKKAAADAIKERYANLKKVILYAPTFRMGQAVDVAGVLSAVDTEEYTLVVKVHPLYREKIEELKDDSIILDEEFPSYEWLSLADKVISDYSAFVIESAITKKPTYIYAYDLEEYDRTTGLNMDFKNEAISRYVYSNAEDLRKGLKEDYDMKALEEFKNKYIDVDTGEIDEASCTSQLADFIESCASDDEKRAKKKGNKIEKFLRKINPMP